MSASLHRTDASDPPLLPDSRLCPRGGRWRLGFSLLELLIVVAIIAIIASLILPSLARAKRRAHRTTCLSNLRQIGVAFTLQQAEQEGRFPDERGLKTALGFRPWTSWPPSDPRAGWAAITLSNLVGKDSIWSCPGIAGAGLSTAPQVAQQFHNGERPAMTSYWLWRFDRTSNPVPLDNFWGKTPETALTDLQQAANPTIGPARATSEVELAVDTYFPATIPSVEPELSGRAAHAGGRNRLMLDLSASYWPDARLSAR